MNKQILQHEVYECYQNEPHHLMNKIARDNLKGEWVILFHNINDCNKTPSPFKFVLFDWETITLLVYREPEIKLISFEDYNECLNLIKQSESKLLNEGLKIYDNENTYERIFLFKDIGKHKIKSLTHGGVTIKAGDFLNTSWGYDQTNVELYTVKKILSNNYFIIQEVAKERRSDYFTADKVKVGSQIRKIDLPLKAYISKDGHMKPCGYHWFRSLRLTDMNEEHYETALGYGH